MGGISKHYILNSGKLVFDNKIVPQLLLLATSCIGALSSSVAVRRHTQTLSDIQQLKEPWRKQVIRLWNLCKAVSQRSSPSGWNLKEYSIRRGRGLGHQNTFKHTAALHRPFKVSKKGKLKPNLREELFGVQEVEVPRARMWMPPPVEVEPQLPDNRIPQLAQAPAWAGPNFAQRLAPMQNDWIVDDLEDIR